MKKITFFKLATFLCSFMPNKNNLVKSMLLVAMFLFVGLSEAKADCILSTTDTGADKTFTALEFQAYANSCSGTITIPSGFTINMDANIECLA